MAKKILYNNSDEVVSKYAIYDTKGDKLISVKFGDLQEQIKNLKALGRFLSTWDCTTGLPDTAPPQELLPYTYVTGDYFLVGKVSSDAELHPNYRPTGTVYSPAASTVVETHAVKVNDIYKFDGTSWVLLESAQVTIHFSQIAGSPESNAALKNALDSKLSANSNSTLTANLKLDSSGKIVDTLNYDILKSSSVNGVTLGNSSNNTNVTGQGEVDISATAAVGAVNISAQNINLNGTNVNIAQGSNGLTFTNAGSKVTTLKPNASTSANNTVNLPSSGGTLVVTDDVLLAAGGSTLNGTVKVTNSGGLIDNNDNVIFAVNTSTGVTVGSSETNTKLQGDGEIVIEADSIKTSSLSGIKIIDSANTSGYGHVLNPNEALTGDATINLPVSSGTLALTSDTLLASGGSTLTGTIKVTNGNGLIDNSNKSVLSVNVTTGPVLGNDSTNTTILGDDIIVTKSESGLKVIDSANASGYGHVLNPNQGLTENVVVNLPSESGTVALTKDVVLTNTDSTLNSKLKISSSGGIYSPNDDEIVKYNSTNGAILGSTSLNTQVKGNSSVSIQAGVGQTAGTVSVSSNQVNLASSGTGNSVTITSGDISFVNNNVTYNFTGGVGKNKIALESDIPLFSVDPQDYPIGDLESPGE